MRRASGWTKRTGKTRSGKLLAISQAEEFGHGFYAIYLHVSQAAAERLPQESAKGSKPPDS